MKMITGSVRFEQLSKKMMSRDADEALTTPMKLVKPDLSAFSFSGYLSKNTKTLSRIQPTPRTPSKKLNTKTLFSGPPTPLCTSNGQRHQSGPNMEVRSDIGGFNHSENNSTADIFSPFLSSDDRDMISPTFHRRIGYSSPHCNPSPQVDPQEWEMVNEFDFEKVAEEEQMYDHLMPPWRPNFANILTRDFFDYLENDQYFLGFEENHISTDDYFAANYDILDVVGQGDFAIVYKCLYRPQELLCSVKKSLSPFTGYTDRIKRLEEARILLNIGYHPHCLHLQLCWEQHGYFFLHSELCSLGSLSNFIAKLSFQEEFLSEQLIWAILLHISLGLKHIHDLGYVHMDLKPSNILIDNSGNLKIADFGLTKLSGENRSMDIEGDNVYMAPEILEGLSERPSDIFSLGLILLELAANIILPSQGETWQKLRHEDFEEIQFEQSISIRLRSLIFQMLRTNPMERPPLEFIISESCMSVPIDFDMKQICDAILNDHALTDSSPFD